MTSIEQTWRYHVIGDGPGQVVHLAGEFDMLAADAMEDLLVSAAADGPLVVDLGAVTFIDSCGIRALIAAHNAARGAGHPYSLANATGQPRRVLSMAGVLDLGSI